jgi:hypothetical protein
MQVLITDNLIDIYDLGYVQKVPPVTQEKDFAGIKLIDSNYQIEADNVDNYFSPIVLANNYQNQKFAIINNFGDYVFNGIIDDMSLSEQNKICRIQARSLLNENLKKFVEDISTDWEYATEIAKRILDSNSIPYNKAAMARSENILSENSVELKADFDYSDGTSVRDALEKIAQYSGAFAYVYNNEFYFEIYTQTSEFEPVNIDFDNDFDVVKRLPDIRFLTNQIVNDYSVGFLDDGSVPATDTTGNNIGQRSRNRYGSKSWPQVISGDDSGQLQFRNESSAQWLGEQGIKFSHDSTLQYAPIEASFSLYYEAINKVSLDGYLNLTRSRFNWTNKLFRIISLMIDEQEYNINVTARSI